MWLTDLFSNKFESTCVHFIMSEWISRYVKRLRSGPTILDVLEN